MTVPDAVIVQQSEWWNVLEALGPLATLLAAAVAGAEETAEQNVGAN